MDFEVVKTDKLEVACDGGKGALGHPRVYLTYSFGEDEVICPYCSRKYIYTPKAG